MRASRVYLTIEAVFGFAHLMMGTIFSVYLIVEADFDPFQLVVMGTILEISVLLFEVPTGVLADHVSRRLSVIVGIFLSGIGFGLSGLVESFWLVAFAQMFWGIGYTFISGAQVAWITDEVGEAEAAKLYVRGAQYWQFSAVMGIAVGVGLATISLGLPLVASGVVLFALTIYLIVAMPEEHFPGRGAAPGETRSPLAPFRGGISMLKTRPVLVLILAVALIQGLSTEGFDRLSHLLLLTETGLPPLGGLDRVLWFGILDGGGLLLAIAGAEYVKRKVDITSHAAAARALALIDVLLIAAVCFFALVTSFYAALIAFWVVALLREVNEPIYEGWVNQGLDPRSRATVNSMASQAHAFGEVGGFGFGFVARASVPGAIFLSGIVRAPALLLFWRALRKGTVATVPPDEMEPVKPEPGPPEDTVPSNAPDRR